MCAHRLKYGRLVFVPNLQQFKINLHKILVDSNRKYQYFLSFAIVSDVRGDLEEQIDYHE